MTWSGGLDGRPLQPFLPLERKEERGDTLAGQLRLAMFARNEETNSTEAAAGSVAKSDLRIRVELIVAIKSNNLIQ